MLSISRTCMCTQLGLSRDIAICSDRSLPYTGSLLTMQDQMQQLQEEKEAILAEVHKPQN